MSDTDSTSLLQKTPNWNSFSETKLISQPVVDDDNRLRLDTSDGLLLMELNALGVRILSANPASNVQKRRDDYGLLLNKPKALTLSLDSESSSNNVSQLSAGSLSVKITHAPLSFELFHNGELQLKSADDGHFVRKHRVPPIAKTPQGWWLSWALKSNEAIYGGGEKWGCLLYTSPSPRDQRGSRMPSSA